MDGIANPFQLMVGGVMAAALFWTLTRLWPSIPAQKRSGRQWLTDVAWWFFTPTIGRAITRLIVLGVVIGIALLVRVGDEPLQTVFANRSILSAQPLWLQTVEVAVLLDLTGYWIHRAKHEAPGWWRLHQVHHSPRVLDWLSAVRVHPLDELTGALLRAVPLFVVGFSPEVFAFAIPGLGLYALLLHSNVRWSFGPLRHVIATPAFHRWHHSRDVHNVNYGGFLVLWDRLFGTFYMPQRAPTAFGVADEAVPEGFFGQLVHPLRRRRVGSL